LGALWHKDWAVNPLLFSFELPGEIHEEFKS